MQITPSSFQDKITTIYVAVDDFCIQNSSQITQLRLESPTKRHRNRATSLSDSEIITILIAFQSSGYTCFKHYYTQFICVYHTHDFPKLVSYNRFIELKQRVAIPMMLYLKSNCLGKCTGISFIDSTHMKVCHNRRIHCHKTFKDIAARGQCSIGWFYGFKLHLIINDKGEILSFYLTRGNVDDRNLKVLTDMTKQLFGKLFGDKGYVSKMLSDILWGNGISLITKPKKNMKGINISQEDKILLRKRAIIECVNDELKNMCNLQHTRHRSINNFLINIMGTLCAYAFFPKKPSLNITYQSQLQLPQLLISA